MPFDVVESRLGSTNKKRHWTGPYGDPCEMWSYDDLCVTFVTGEVCQFTVDVSEDFRHPVLDRISSVIATPDAARAVFANRQVRWTICERMTFDEVESLLTEGGAGLTYLEGVLTQMWSGKDSRLWWWQSST